MADKNIVKSKVRPLPEFSGSTGKYRLRYRIISEDVELEEGKVAKALAVGAMALASMGAKAHTDTTKSVAQLAQERHSCFTILSL